MVGLAAQRATERSLRQRQTKVPQGRHRPDQACRLDIGGVRVHRTAVPDRASHILKVIPRSEVLAVCSVCLSDPEQAEVAP